MYKYSSNLFGNLIMENDFDACTHSFLLFFSPVNREKLVNDW
jgi:hypothetical protein